MHHILKHVYLIEKLDDHTKLSVCTFFFSSFSLSFLYDFILQVVEGSDPPKKSYQMYLEDKIEASLFFFYYF